jgi:transcription elongation GreA/GreB family factor
MSRAFVNEDNATAHASPPVERPVSLQPNYVTESGMAQLRARVDEVQELHAEQATCGDKADQQLIAELERDLRYFQQRMRSAQLVPPVTCTEIIQIGSWATFIDETGAQQRVCLVGEDQADVALGLINWASPLGRALLGAAVGDEVLWERPAGDLRLEVTEISVTP